MKNLNANLEKTELSREKIALEDGKMCDLVRYHVKDYGYAEFVENIEVSSGEFRRARAMIPFKYLDADMSRFRWDVYGEDVALQRKTAESFLSHFEAYRKKGKGLYIFSRTKGSGKTFLSCALANEITEKWDISVKFVSVPELLEMTKKGYRDFTEKEELSGIRDAQLLIVDDIGAEMKKDWIDTELYRLIDFRYSNKRVTIFTSNLPVDDLKLNERIVDRIYTMSVRLNLPEKPIRTMYADAENRVFIQDILKNAP